MPVPAEDRVYINLGAARILAARERAAAEGKELAALMADALDAYLQGPLHPPAALMPGLASEPGNYPADVRNLIDGLRILFPVLTSVVENHNEVMDTLDTITSELGHRIGAAHALEQAGHYSPGEG